MLMKALELLEAGCRERDWRKAFESYEMLSGHEIIEADTDIPLVLDCVENKELITSINKAKKKPGRPKKVKPEFNWGDTEVYVTPRPPLLRPKPSQEALEAKSDVGVQKSSGSPKTSNVRFTGNTFVDDGTVAVEDKLIDKKLSKGWKKPAARQAHQYVEVVCSSKSCGETVQVPPDLYIGDSSYFCNKCLSKKRG